MNIPPCSHSLLAGLLAALSGGLGTTLAAEDASPDFSSVPGVVIDHHPAASGIYIGSPSLAVLPDGSYLATHDQFGPKSTEHVSAITQVFRSQDRGESWSQVATIDGAFWSTVFVHRGDAYLIGTTKHHGDAVIRRSRDGGRTWTSPEDGKSGRLLEGQYHCAPMPVVVHGGRIWRAIEDAGGSNVWGQRYRAMVLSAPEDADLLDADNWTASNYLARDPEWLDGQFNAWLEGNIVVAPEGSLVNILRVDAPRQQESAAIVNVSDDGRTVSFDPESGLIPFPGGSKKFTIRWDPETRQYWSLSNYIPPAHHGRRTASTRNTLALIRSPDLRDWTVRSIVLYHPDPEKHGFQYVDWLFEGEDLIVASRTAYDDGVGGARNAHDANFMTFHRIEGFRELTMEDSVATPGGG